MFLPMAKVELVGPKNLLPETLNILHRLGTLHFEPIAPAEDADQEEIHPIALDEENAALCAALEDKVTTINGILESLPPQPRWEQSAEFERHAQMFARHTGAELLEEVDRAIDLQGERTRTLSAQKDRVRLDLMSLRRYETVLQKIQPLAERMSVPPDHQTTAFLVDRNQPEALEVIRHELANLDRVRIRMEHENIDENTTAGIVVYPQEISARVHEALADTVNLIRLPAEYAGMSPQEALAAIQQRVEGLPGEVKQADGELAEVANESFYRLKALAATVRDRVEELQCTRMCGETEFTFMVQGWVPRKDLRRSMETIKRELGGRVLIEEREVDAHELGGAPVVMDNPRWARPFELVLSILQPPRYGTVDPTPFVAVLFPAFFGIIVGDAGYGLVWLIVSLLLMRKFKGNPTVRSIIGIFMSGALSTIFFGVLYGEAFGDLPHRFHLVREIHLFGGAVMLPFDRMKFMMQFLYLTVGIGAFSMLIGLILGVINAVRGHHRKHAFEKVGMTMTLLSLILFALFTVTKVSTVFPVILLVGGLVLLVYGGGMMGVMEIFGLIGNVFSFARIMALGLSGVVLAFVANTLALNMGNLVVGLIIAGLLHSIALLVHAFSPSIHAVRLNLIEFFNRFYESGGKTYKPFNRGR